MKLLFIWINQNDTGFINQQGFNFDINYRFNMSQSEDKSKYILTYKKHSTQYIATSGSVYCFFYFCENVKQVASFNISCRTIFNGFRAVLFVIFIL